MNHMEAFYSNMVLGRIPHNFSFEIITVIDNNNDNSLFINLGLRPIIHKSLTNATYSMHYIIQKSLSNSVHYISRDKKPYIHTNIIELIISSFKS